METKKIPQVQKQFDWIFLDIDGVLAPDGRYEKWEPQSIEELCCFDKKCLDNLEAVLRKYPTISLAISSSWKEQFPFEKVQSLFSPDIGKRVVGYTPFPDNTDPEWARRREIALFLQERNVSKARWLAIDDLASHFDVSAGDEVLIVKSAYHGFSEEDAQRLDKKLSENQLTALPKSQPIKSNPELDQLRNDAIVKLQQRVVRLEQIINILSNNLGTKNALFEARDIFHTLSGSLGFIGLGSLGQHAKTAEVVIDDSLKNNQYDATYIPLLIMDIKNFIKQAKLHLV